MEVVTHRLDEAVGSCKRCRSAMKRGVLSYYRMEGEEGVEPPPSWASATYSCACGFRVEVSIELGRPLLGIPATAVGA